MKMTDKMFVWFMDHIDVMLPIMIIAIMLVGFKDSKWSRITKLTCQVCEYEDYRMIGYYRDPCPDCGLNTVDRAEVVRRVHNWKREVKPFVENYDIK